MTIQKLIIIATLVFVSGCTHLSNEGKKAISNAALTAKERSSNFEAVKDKLTAVNPIDNNNVTNWKTAHSEGLAAQAKALSDIDTIINGAVKPKILIRDIK